MYKSRVNAQCRSSGTPLGICRIRNQEILHLASRACHSSKWVLLNQFSSSKHMGLIFRTEPTMAQCSIFHTVIGIGAKCAWIPPAGSREGRCCQQTDGKYGCWWGLWAQPGQQLLRGWESPCERSARKTLHPWWDAFTFPLVSKAAELFPFIAPPFLIAVLCLNQTSFSCPCMQLKVNVFWMTWGRDNFTADLILIQH